MVRLLLNKNAVLTGCSHGIGKATLRLFAEHGANIWACARKPSDDFENMVHELSDAYGVEIWPVYFDLTNYSDLKEAVKTISSSKRKVDILLNNAGITYNALFMMSSLSMMREVFEVNFFSHLVLTQYIAKIMMRQKSGSIINISSSAGIDGNPGRSVYGASKAAIICATKSMAAELGEFGIRVNSIAPGITQTRMLSSMTEKVITETLENTALKRLGTPEDIGHTALFLASDMSSYLTGQVIRVDGGM
ncbi:glucose 1-dehydrogenase [Methanospirillum sp. J.3.6.1-F.2.7.3]|uniref:Glucose 1-dehydrogenase n=1 Tax=Methanospirillum purgamenti TaxID=2834276 RepID=A0A8E7AXE3_9EURY|nr:MULTISPECIES: glucose 1-dehydrogenase [Methanospirillum]MDX8551849.1 glucose 1-dehydrogenase [Methanospirillum hungatei]QVV89135.1 glucose 1-dehydrogenase [Methanospirillum sp. J.3.6.1-F.2.7.3]